MSLEITDTAINDITIKWDLFKQAPIGVYIIQDSKFKAVNREFISYTGYSEKELLEINPLDIVSQSFKESVRSNAIGMLRFERDKPYEYLAKTKEGKDIWVVEAVLPTELNGKRAVTGFFMDIASIVKESFTDVLTGLFNRRFFNEKLNDEVKRSDRYNSSLSLILLDVDNFKRYNDTYGHPQGDRILSEVGNTIRKSIRETDFGVRYGGEEFAVILPEASTEDASIVAHRILKGVKENTASLNYGVTISAGISCYTKNLTISDFISATDSALYKAKECGRNCVKFY